MACLIRRVSYSPRTLSGGHESHWPLRKRARAAQRNLLLPRTLVDGRLSRLVNLGESLGVALEGRALPEASETALRLHWPF